MFIIQNIEIVGCAVATTDHPRWNENIDHYGIGGVIGLLAGGSRGAALGVFVDLGYTHRSWASIQVSASDAYYHVMYSDSSILGLGQGPKKMGCSVRAMRNATAIEKAYHDGEIILNAYTDGSSNTYDGVKIGDQIWTTKNLQAINYQTGGAINEVTNGDDWAALTSGGYCFFLNNYSDYGKHYGALYNWFAVNSDLVTGSWRVPSIDDWDELTDYIIKEFGYMGFIANNVGVFLKSCRQINHPNA